MSINITGGSKREKKTVGTIVLFLLSTCKRSTKYIPKNYLRSFRCVVQTGASVLRRYGLKYISEYMVRLKIGYANVVSHLTDPVVKGFTNKHR